MKTDRELLKLAAKAHGSISFDRFDLADVFVEFRDGGMNHWNPLTDDGDALQLAVKLRIDLEWREDGRIAAYRHAHADGYCFTAIESSREDCAASTRRAIVRAAASIGEQMK